MWLLFLWWCGKGQEIRVLGDNSLSFQEVAVVSPETLDLGCQSIPSGCVGWGIVFALLVCSLDIPLRE
jgi:hypothetical protein